MKRVLAAAAVLVIGAAAVGLSAMAAPSKTNHQGKRVTLRLVTKEVGFNFVDNPPRQGFNAPPLIGDQLTFTSDIQTRSGARAGPSPPPAPWREAAFVPTLSAMASTRSRAARSQGSRDPAKATTPMSRLSAAPECTRASQEPRSKSHVATTALSRTSRSTSSIRSSNALAAKLGSASDTLPGWPRNRRGDGSVARDNPPNRSRDYETTLETVRSARAAPTSRSCQPEGDCWFESDPGSCKHPAQALETRRAPRVERPCLYSVLSGGRVLSLGHPAQARPSGNVSRPCDARSSARTRGAGACAGTPRASRR